MQVLFVKAQDFVGAGHGAFADDALVRLLDGRGKLSEDAINAPEDLLRLAPAPAGLRPAFIERGAVPARVRGDGFGQRLHLPQVGLLLFPAPGAAARSGHGHAALVHPREEAPGRFHPRADAPAADEHGRFHQGAHGVTQQHPVGGKMDVRLQARAVQEHEIEFDPRLQPHACRPRFAACAAQKFIEHRAHRLGCQPGGVSLQPALAGHLHPVDFPDAAKSPAKRALRQAPAHHPIGRAHEQFAQHLASQRQPGLFLMPCNVRVGEFHSSLAILRAQRIQTQPHKERFDSAAAQQPVDAFELDFKIGVILVADDLRQRWTQRQLKRQDVGGRR